MVEFVVGPKLRPLKAPSIQIGCRGFCIGTLMKLPDDFYENESNWQEFDCPKCKVDFDVFPPQRPGAHVHCCHCDHEWLSPAYGQAYLQVPVSEENELGMVCIDAEDMN